MVKLDVTFFLKENSPILKMNHLQRWSLTSTPKISGLSSLTAHSGQLHRTDHHQERIHITACCPGFRGPVHTGQHPARWVRARGGQSPSSLSRRTGIPTPDFHIQTQEQPGVGLPRGGKGIGPSFLCFEGSPWSHGLKHAPWGAISSRFSAPHPPDPEG